MKRLNNRAQITIFVIMGLMLLSLVMLFMQLKKEDSPAAGGKSETDLRGSFETCLEDKLRDTVKTLTDQGGYMKNILNISFMPKERDTVQNISYLCYTAKEYISCTNQEPMLMNHLEEEIHTELAEQVRVCFDELASNLERRGETVEAEYSGFKVELAPRKISVYVDGKITSTKSGQTVTQTDIRGVFSSRLYETTRVVQEIINQESTYCNFELLGFMLFYPEFDIDKTVIRNSTIIYTVKHSKGVERFSFAIRSCSFPPAF